MIQHIVRQYKGPCLRGYVGGKLRHDPIYPAALALLRDSGLPVLDVGCGLGLLAFYLREGGYAGRIVGVDSDQRKIRHAQLVAAGGYAGLTFTVGDVLDTGEFRGNVAVLDVLHYLRPEHQARLLERAAAQVAPGGYCLIRDTLRDASWRFRVTQCEEALIKAFAWIRSGGVHYPEVDDVMAPFRARGFECAVSPLWGATPFNSYLFTFRAPGAPRGET